MMVPLDGEFCAEETILVEVASPNRKRHYDAVSEGRSPRLVANGSLVANGYSMNISEAFHV